MGTVIVDGHRVMKRLLTGVYRIRQKQRWCDWPSWDDANRKMLVQRDDVLMWDPKREAFTKICGVFYHGIVIPQDEVEWYDQTVEADFVM